MAKPMTSGLFGEKCGLEAVSQSLQAWPEIHVPIILDREGGGAHHLYILSRKIGALGLVRSRFHVQEYTPHANSFNTGLLQWQFPRF